MARLASGKASRTARVTAAMRYRHWLGGAKPLVFADREAGLFLDWPVALLSAPTPLSDWGLGRLIGPLRALEGEVLARARYVEDALLAGLDGALRQMVILGAGFDTTAIRHSGADCRFFEVDHPATQAEKRRILARHRDVRTAAVYVPVDFASDTLVVELLRAGFDPALPTLVSWLGVSMYLPHDALIETLAQLRLILASGSAVILDSFLQRSETSEDELALFDATRALTAARGEPMVGLLDSSRFAADAQSKDFAIAEKMPASDTITRWFAHQPRVIHPPKSAVFWRLSVE